MEKLLIHGGNMLKGSVEISSAKNSLLALIPATILINDEVIIKNCTKITDVLNSIEILKGFGCKAEFVGNDLCIDTRQFNNVEIDKEIFCKFRASILYMGALLSRKGKCKVYKPGGCCIGCRPIDIHIDAINNIGYLCDIKENVVIAEKEKNQRIFYKYKFPKISVGATENAIISSVIGEKDTYLYNCAMEPEITDLINFLNNCGADIVGAGTKNIHIKGVKSLHGCVYKPVGDRIEAGTYILSAMICGGEIDLYNVNLQNIYYLINKIVNNACKITAFNDIISMKVKRGSINFPKIIQTAPFPYFPTDMQSQMLVASMFGKKDFSIQETLFETRFLIIEELKKMHAKIDVEGNIATVHPNNKLIGANMVAKDLRGGASLVMACLGVEDISIVCGVENIDRGYYKIEEKFSLLGANIRRI